MRGPILILGIQGAGKTTLGRMLARSTGGVHRSAGTLLRLHQKNAGSWAEEIKQRLGTGEGVDTDISYGLLRESVQGLPQDSLLILDGYPREVSQVPLLAETIGADPNCALLLNLPRPIAVDRIIDRTVCDSCDAAFGPGVPPEERGRCDDCGGTLSHRADDTPQAIARRLEGWGRKSRAIVSHYEEEGILVHIDAARSVKQVLEQVLATVGDFRN